MLLEKNLASFFRRVDFLRLYNLIAHSNLIGGQNVNGYLDVLVANVMQNGCEIIPLQRLLSLDTLLASEFWPSIVIQKRPYDNAVT